MRQIDYLYFKQGVSTVNVSNIHNYTVHSFVPFSLSFPWGKLSQESLSFRTILARLFFKIITKGNFKIYYTTNSEGHITHTSYVLGKCFKFPFLNKYDKEIGPCATSVAYRGQGIYPRVLRYITEQEGSKGNYYMLVKPKNQSSIRGIEKAGFTKVGSTIKTKLRRYIKQ